jgi:hypothetical protein
MRTHPQAAPPYHRYGGGTAHPAPPRGDGAEVHTHYCPDCRLVPGHLHRCPSGACTCRTWQPPDA